MLDLKITGGQVIDGTGRPAFHADVGIAGGRVVEVGRISGPAGRTIDADGALVTPGFTDIHTHYDGQASWDRELTPSTWHGVTTVVMGNCGVGFAPVRPTDHDRLIALMEGVEDIPGTALAEGLTWEWEGFPSYLDALDRLEHTADMVCHVPHDALRVYVMGERAVAGAEATDDDIARMRALLSEALDAGAVGFSTGRSDTHRAATGEYTPASEASRRELVGIAGALAGRSHGVLQAVSDFDFLREVQRFDEEFELLDAMVDAGGGCPFSLSVLQRDHVPAQYLQILGRLQRMNDRGVPARAQVAPRAIGVMLGLEATFHPFMGFPSYKEIAGLPLAQRVVALREPARRQRILSERSTPVAGDGSPLPRLADELLGQLDMLAMRIFRLGDPLDYEPTPDTSLGAEALRRGIPSLQVLYDALLEDDGQALLYFPLLNYTGMDLEAVRTMLTHPLSLPGLSDGGAHVGTICDASFSTYLLTHWGRDRASGRLPLEQLVRLQARETARHLGLMDRGELTPGQRADVNIIDLQRLSLDRPQLHADLPAGGKRLLQRARGYRATLVAGQVILEDDELTGVYPGRVVRCGQTQQRPPGARPGGPAQSSSSAVQ
ncbi:MAG TPA: D-aminoacylase [Deltaproteobacteria bacterium]|nr:D-aminoacylase [Deltaproteobacteria bacterium]